MRFICISLLVGLGKSRVTTTPHARFTQPHGNIILCLNTILTFRSGRQGAREQGQEVSRRVHRGLPPGLVRQGQDQPLQAPAHREIHARARSEGSVECVSSFIKMMLGLREEISLVFCQNKTQKCVPTTLSCSTSTMLKCLYCLAKEVL